MAKTKKLNDLCKTIKECIDEIFEQEPNVEIVIKCSNPNMLQKNCQIRNKDQFNVEIKYEDD